VEAEAVVDVELKVKVKAERLSSFL